MAENALLRIILFIRLTILPWEEDTLEPDILKNAVWSEIAENALRRGGALTCIGSELRRYLSERLGPGRKILSPEETKTGQAAYLVAWGRIPAENETEVLGQIHNFLAPGGEAELYGYYLNPSREDIFEWGRRCRELGGDGFFPLPLPEASAIAPVIAALNTSPFNRYIVRKHGVYFQALLTREEND